MQHIEVSNIYTGDDMQQLNIIFIFGTCQHEFRRPKFSVLSGGWKSHLIPITTNKTLKPTPNSPYSFATHAT